MTALQVHTCCQYLTSGENWRSADHKARIIVKCVKGEEFNGYADITVDGKRTRLNSNNKDVGLELLGKVLGSRIIELTDDDVTLVPVPNSSAFVGGDESFRTLQLANAVARNASVLTTVIPAFLWKNQKQKQHQIGGYRHASQFIPNLSLRWQPASPVVLVDDVVTSGSQMLACTHILRKLNVDVIFGIAVGRTTTVQTDNTLSWVSDKVEQFII